MGNRAVITTKENWRNCGVGVYLHWNGGRDSVEAFLKYCELKGYRPPSSDNYGWARLCQVIGNFFGGSDSIGIDSIWHLDRDNGDNGVYIIDGWQIVNRIYYDYEEQDGYDLNEMLIAIDKAQPEKERIGDFLQGEEIPIEELKAGDEVVMIDWRGEIETAKVIGIGADEVVNGYNVKGVPYVDIYGSDYSGNINNYLKDGVNWRLKKSSAPTKVSED